jgi:hypothetical protein
MERDFVFSLRSASLSPRTKAFSLSWLSKELLEKGRNFSI